MLRGVLGKRYFCVKKKHLCNAIIDPQYENQISKTLLQTNRTSSIIFQELRWLNKCSNPNVIETSI